MKQNGLLLLTVADVGRRCDPPLTPHAVRAALKAGRIRATTRTPGGMSLFSPADVEAFDASRRARRAPRLAPATDDPAS